MADPMAASAIDMVRFFFISSNMTLVLELRDTKEHIYFKIFSKVSLQPATCSLQPASCNLPPAT
jgi:hypothetical protein